MRTPLPLVTLVAFAIVASACSSSSDAETSTTSTVPVTTTTLATTTTTTQVTTTTTEPPTTTSTEPPEVSAAVGELPEALLARVGELYSWLSDRRNPVPAGTSGLPGGIGLASRAYQEVVEATAVIDTVERDIDGETVQHEIGVVHVGDDTLIATNDDGAWEIVGIVADDITWLGGPILVLVLGSDARPGQSQLRFRADSIHILAFDTDNGRGTILGFPRDSYVEGPNRGFDKFAHHMASAGPEVMLEVATELTGLELDGYAVTGFVGFQGLIGVLGGLLIDLPQSVDTGNGWDNFKAGLQRLSPLRALQLARARKGVPGGDFGRSANQGLIMLATLDMVQSMGIDAMPALGQAFFDHGWSDVSTDRLAQFAAFAFLVDPGALQNVVLPGTVQTINRSSVVVLDDIVDEVFVDLADGWLEHTDW